jgi:pimeloyl-ACP methyl ester carboxylesterase
MPTERALVDDGSALVADIAARHPEVVLIGRSLGSGVAVQVARRHPPARLVLVTPFDSLAAVARRHYPWLPVDLLLRDRYDSAAHAASIHVPTTLVAAADDAIVPAEHARALARAFAPGRARLVVLAGAGHNDIDAHPGYAPALIGTGTR